MRLKHPDGRVKDVWPFLYYTGSKFGWLDYWPEMLDDLRGGWTKE